MKSISLSLPVALFLLAGCDAGLSTYYKTGAQVSRLKTDTVNCEVKALKDAPVAMQTRQRAPIFYPGTQICNGATCYYRPGFWVDGGFYTVDVNQGLRERVLDQCMAQKGYQPVNLPRCSPQIVAAAPPARTRILPKLNEQSCAIRYEDGSWQIVTPVAPTVSE